MREQEITNFMESFIRSKEWRKIREALLWKLESPYWMIDHNGNFIYRVKHNRRYCDKIKETEEGRRRCELELHRHLEEIRQTKTAVVTRCFAGFLGFITPMLINGELIGAIGDCQIIDSRLKPEAYKEITRELGLDFDEFVSYLKQEEAIPKEILEVEVGLIHLLCQSSIEIVLQGNRIRDRETLLQNIVRFYRLLGEKQNLLLGLDLERVFELIVSIASKSVDCEICSLMMLDPKTNEFVIKAAVGLPEDVVRGTRVKADEGVAGYVFMHGEPILVTDITQDPRFKRPSRNHYYTESFISAPIRVGGKVVGVLNMNNKADRRIFNEDDLKLLALITDHASLALEGSIAYQRKKMEDLRIKKSLEEYKEELRLQTERFKLALERLRLQTQETARWKEEAEVTKIEALTAARLHEEAERLREEARLAKEEARIAKEMAERERLRAEAARLNVEAEDIEARMEIELIKERVECLRSQVEHLRAEESRLRAQIKEGEQLVARVEEVEGLREETSRLRAQIQEMKKEEDRLRAMIAETERLRERAEEAERLRVQTEELRTLYELSKEIVSIADTKQILSWTLEKVQPLLGYDIGAYLLWDDGKLKVELISLGVVGDGFVENFKARILDNWRSLAPKGKEGDLEIEIKGKGMKGEIVYSEGMRIYSVPIIDRGSPTGILYVGYLSGDDGELVKRILPIVGTHASVAIEKTRVYLETKELAERDALTNVYNFRYFSKHFIDEVKRSRRYNHPLSLMMIDLDHLKEFNDRFGHGEGNNLLRTVADLIKRNIRDVDCIARFGGDEFVVILPETPKHEAEEVARRILNAVRGYRYVVRGKEYKISVSIGIGNYPEIGIKSAKDFFMRTDEALYQAKSKGRDQFYMYQPFHAMATRSTP